MPIVSAMRVRLVGNTDSTSLVKSSSIPTVNNIDLVKSMPAQDLKAYNENPWRLVEGTNYKERPSTLSYNILYQMSVRNSVVSAVINTRINQVSIFTKPARFSADGVGYRVQLRDPKQVPTTEQQQVMNAIELFLENCGFNDDPNRDDFDTFIRKIVRDSLTYDQMCFEIVPDRAGRPAEMVAVDAATIRAASENYTNTEFSSFTGTKTEAPTGSDDVKWVQVIDGSVVSWFSGSELAFGVRNPRTNINMQPYGFSELEMLIQQITAHLYAEEYNERYFSNGGTTKGIINIKADPNGIGNKEQLDSFKRQWRAQVNGMSGAWKTPVLQVPGGIEYVSVNQSNRDMEYSQWINYLINIVCAVYQIDPAEVNFSNNGGASEQSSVFETSEEQKLKNSKDKGLKPLLRFIESILNKYVVSRFSQDFVFSFTGLDEHTEQEKAALEAQQVRVSKTINEIRAEHGDKPIEYGDVILDASWLTYVNQTKSMEQQQKMMGAMGGGAAPGGDDTEEPPEGESSDDESTDEPENPDNSDEPEGSEESDDSNDSEDYSGYLNSDTSDNESSDEYTNDNGPDDENEEEPTNKSMSRLIITIDD